MTAENMVANARNIPPISDAALRVMLLLDQPEAHNEEIIQVLKHDSMLTAKLLRVCNSSALGFAQSIHSVDQAVLLLGHRQILQMVLAIVVGGTMAAPLPSYEIEANQLWWHSLIAATAAEGLLEHGVNLNTETPLAFTAGLLHDIGKLVMSQFLTPERRQAVLDHVVKGFSNAEAERAVLGTDHAEVGACLLRKWRIPDKLVEAVGHHHAPIMDPKPTLSVVAFLGDCLAHLAGAAPGWHAYALRANEPILQNLEINSSKMQCLLIAVQERCQNMNRFIGPLTRIPSLAASGARRRPATGKRFTAAMP